MSPDEKLEKYGITYGATEKKPFYMSLEVDKGWSWIICASACINLLIIAGTAKLSGILFVEYEELFQQGASSTSWVTSTWSLSATIMAPLAGYLTDTLSLGKLRVMMFALYIIGSVMVALAGCMPNLPLTILVFGVILGSCFALTHGPLLSMPSHYFQKNRNTAYGIVFTGSSLGGVILPAFFTWCVSQVGFRGAMIILSGIWFHTLFAPVVTWPMKASSVMITHQLDPESEATNKITVTNHLKFKVNGEDTSFEMQHLVAGKLLNSAGENKETAIIQDKEIVVQDTVKKQKKWIVSMMQSYGRFLRYPNMPLVMLALLLGIFACYSQYFVIPLLVKELGIPKLTGSLMLSVCNAVEIASRIITGIIADRCGVAKRTILLVSFSLTGCVALVLSFFLNIYVLFAFAAVFGAFGGTAVALSVPVMVDLADMDQKGTASAMFTLLFGVATTVGPVILSIVGEALGSYVHSFRASAVAYLLAVLVYMIPLLKEKFNERSSSSRTRKA